MDFGHGDIETHPPQCSASSTEIGDTDESQSLVPLLDSCLCTCRHATKSSTWTEPPNAKNAMKRLIVAQPEMLETLKGFVYIA
jgi:hypothetical protein